MPPALWPSDEQKCFQ